MRTIARGLRSALLSSAGGDGSQKASSIRGRLIVQHSNRRTIEASIGASFLGEDPEIMARAARVVRKAGYDLIT